MKRFLKAVLVLAMLAAVVVGTSACSSGGNSTRFTGEYWYDYGIGQYVPTMKLRSGKTPTASGVINNSDAEMFFQIDNASKEDDFVDYVALLMEYGFTNVVSRTNKEYIATDNSKHKVRVYNWGNGKITVEVSLVK